MEATVVQILAKFRADVSEFNKRVGDVEAQLNKLQGSTSKTSDSVESSFGKMESAAAKFATGVGAAAAVAGTALTAFAVKSFNAAARVEELDVALQAVGSSTGIGYEALNEAAKGVRSMGIEMEIAQQSVLKFAQNNLDLAQAQNVARVAQDLAIIGGKNSTDTFNQLTHAIITGRSEVLKSVGIQKSAGQAYAEFAASIGKTTKELTYQERQAAVLALVMKEGERVNGTYEAAMTSAGKVLKSFARINNELQVAMGTALTQAFGPMILQVYELYKNIVKLVSEGGLLYPVIQAIGAVLTNLVTPLTNAITKVKDLVIGMNSAAKSADEAKARYETFLPPISKMGDEMQRFLPLLAAVGSGFASFGGAALLKNVPILGSFLGMLNPVAVAMAVLVATSPKLQQAFANLFKALTPLIPALMEVGKIVVDVANIAIHLLAEGVNLLAKAISKTIAFVKENATVFQVLGGIVVALTVAVMAYYAQVIIVNAVTKLWYIFTQRQAIATAFLTKAQKVLNAVMAMNPIGVVIAAVALLIAGFIMLWNNSEKFRKGVIAVAKTGLSAFASLIRGIGPLAEAMMKGMLTPLRLFLMALSKIPKVGGMFKSALGVLDTGLNSISGWAETAATKIEGLVGTLDKFENYRFKLPKFDTGFKMPEFKKKEIYEGNGPTGGEDEGVDTTGGKGLTDAAKKAIENLRDAIQKYEDFIRNEFVEGFMGGADKARETVLKSLELLKGVFDAKSEGLKGTALDFVTKAYRNIEKSIRDYIPTLEAISEELVTVQKQLDAAQKRLEVSLEAGRKIGALLRKPFGEPSEINKAMGFATATVDGVISLYDSLINLINDRFVEDAEGNIDPRRNALAEQIEQAFSQLVPLIKERDELIQRIKDNKELQKEAQQSRKAGIQTLQQILAEPFGSPSELENALSSAEASADSIINTYQRIIEAVNQRYAGLDKSTDLEKSKLIEFLTKETEQLLKLADAREKAFDELSRAQEELTKILQEQESFASSLIKSLKSFATEIVKFSNEESKAVISVIKTATGLVITQVKSSTSGMDQIIKQMEERLSAITDFANNANLLLARGLNKDYLKELIQAGPEAAGMMLKTLAGASQEQIKKVNELYKNIGKVSEGFGGSMAGTFYGPAVGMAEGFLAGAQSQYGAINKEMKQLRQKIAKALEPLKEDSYLIGSDMYTELIKLDEERVEKITESMETLQALIVSLLEPLNAIGKTAGDDLMNGLVTALKLREEELKTQINLIASAISSAMSAAAASISVVIASLDALMAKEKQYAESKNTTSGQGLVDSPDVNTNGNSSIVKTSNSTTNATFTINTEKVDEAMLENFVKKMYREAELTI